MEDEEAVKSSPLAAAIELQQGEALLGRSTSVSTTLPPSLPPRKNPDIIVQGKPTLWNAQERPAKKREGLIALWWLELLSAGISLAATGSIIAILYSLDGKPYQEWRVGSHVSITPNTLIAIISTIAKAAFLFALAEGISQLKWIYYQRRDHPLSDLNTFDHASRGPFGSLKLLWSVRNRAILASIGAALTVLSIATEPFTQQILSYPTRLDKVENTTASIGSTNALDVTSAELHNAEGTTCE